MKILQVVHGFIPYSTAGTEVYSYKLSKELAKRHEVFVFFRVNNQANAEYSLEYQETENLKTFSINYFFRDFNSFGETYRNNIIDKKFAEIIDTIKPDIVHIHHLLFLSHGIVDEIKKRNIPIVYTLHDYWLICYRGQLINDELNICKGKLNCSDCLKYLLGIRKYSMYLYLVIKKIIPVSCLKWFKKVYLLARWQGFLCKLREWEDSSKKICSSVEFFIAPSQFMKNKFIEYGVKFSEKNFLISPYGFDCKNIMLTDKVKSRTLRIGYLGTLLPSKGVHILISAFKDIDNSAVELLIYGKVPAYSSFQGYSKSLEAMIGSDKRIKLMGEYANNEIARIYTNIDLSVIPSLWYENSPLVIQEAFLSKTPVIASRIGGIPELVSDGVNGLLFKPGDAQDLKEKIQSVIGNPHILEKFKENMPPVKSIEDNAEEIEEVYSNLIGK